jgi:hypothetical protein
LKTFLENVIRDSVTYTEHAKRKTVTALDVVYALKRSGRTLYGCTLVVLTLSMCLLSLQLVSKALPFRFYSGVLYLKLYIHFFFLELLRHKFKRELQALLATSVFGAAIGHVYLWYRISGQYTEAAASTVMNSGL